MWTFCTFGSSSAARGPSDSGTTRLFTTRPYNVSASALGCSKISLSMKCRYGPFSAASWLHCVSCTARVTGLPFASKMRTRVARDLGDVALLEIDEPLRDGQERGHAARDEVLAYAQAR